MGNDRMLWIIIALFALLLCAAILICWLISRRNRYYIPAGQEENDRLGEMDYRIRQMKEQIAALAKPDPPGGSAEEILRRMSKIEERYTMIGNLDEKINALECRINELAKNLRSANDLLGQLNRSLVQTDKAVQELIRQNSYSDREITHLKELLTERENAMD